MPKWLAVLAVIEFALRRVLFSPWFWISGLGAAVAYLLMR